jgi:hypothetical protein
MPAANIRRGGRSASFMMWFTTLNAIPGVVAIGLALTSIWSLAELRGLTQHATLPELQGAIATLAARQLWIVGGVIAAGHVDACLRRRCAQPAVASSASRDQRPALPNSEKGAAT